MEVSKWQSINANYSSHPQNTNIFNSLVVKKHSNNQNKNLPCCQRTMDFMRLVGLDILGRCWQWEIRFQAQFPFLEKWSKGELSSRTRKLWNLELWLEVTARTSSFPSMNNHKLTKATKSNTILEQIDCIDLAPTKHCKWKKGCLPGRRWVRNSMWGRHVKRCGDRTTEDSC